MKTLLNVAASLLASSLLLMSVTAEAKDIWAPPAKYDSGPLINAQYQRPIIERLSPAQLIIACQGKHLACSYAEIGSPCEIFLPLVGWEPMVRHEMGHCRGWSADHKS